MVWVYPLTKANIIRLSRKLTKLGWRRRTKTINRHMANQDVYP